MPNGNENIEEENRDGSATSRCRERDHKGEDAMGITRIKKTKNSQKKWQNIQRELHGRQILMLL
jgi:hypothetical protein